MRRATLRKAVKDGQQIISIHALHEESDHLFKGVVTMAENFNPRSP